MRKSHYANQKEHFSEVSNAVETKKKKRKVIKLCESVFASFTHSLKFTKSAVLKCKVIKCLIA